jgi:hypothetical protein
MHGFKNVELPVKFGLPVKEPSSFICSYLKLLNNGLRRPKHIGDTLQTTRITPRINCILFILIS